MEDVETGRRLRAARGYAGLDADDVAKALSFSVSTLYRTEAGTRRLTEPEKKIVADLCSLPLGFFSVDFASDAERAADAADQLRDRLDRLEARVSDVDAGPRLRNVETQLAELWRTVNRLGDRTRKLERDARQRDADLLERETEDAGRQVGTRRGGSAASDRAPDDLG